MKAPGPKLGTIEGQLKAVVTLFELRFTSFEFRLASAPLGEQRAQHERKDGHHGHGRLSALNALHSWHSRIAEVADTQGRCANDRQRHKERASDRKDPMDAGGQPHQQRQHNTDRAKGEPRSGWSNHNIRAGETHNGKCPCRLHHLAWRRQRTLQLTELDQQWGNHHDADGIR